MAVPVKRSEDKNYGEEASGALHVLRLGGVRVQWFPQTPSFFTEAEEVDIQTFRDFLAYCAAQARFGSRLRRNPDGYVEVQGLIIGDNIGRFELEVCAAATARPCACGRPTFGRRGTGEPL